MDIEMVDEEQAAVAQLILDHAPPVVVIGYNVWQNRFSGDSAVIGRTFRLGATQHVVAEQVGDPKQTLAYAELVKRKAALESEQAQMSPVYKPKHPDMIAKQAEIDSVQRGMDAMLAETKEKVTEKRKKLESQIDPRLNSIKYELQSVAAQAAILEKRLAATESQIADISRRLNGVPGTTVELEAINRDFHFTFQAGGNEFHAAHGGRRLRFRRR